MGPGCPVCVTDVPEVDEAVALARQGVRIATYGDMLRVPGTLAFAGRRAGRRRDGSTSSTAWRRRSSSRARRATRSCSSRRGSRPPPWPPRPRSRAAAELLDPVGAQVHPAGDGDRRGDAGHRDRGLPRGRARRDDHGLGRVRAVRRAPPHAGGGGGVRAARHPRRPGAARRDDRRRRGPRRQLPSRAASPATATAPRRMRCGRCSSRHGGPLARHRARPQRQPAAARRVREWDARRRFTIDLSQLWDRAPAGAGAAVPVRRHHGRHRSPHDCNLFGNACTPDAPVGACMVSTEGTCRIWHQYGGRPDLRPAPPEPRHERPRTPASVEERISLKPTARAAGAMRALIEQVFARRLR
jgi:hydrogenase expression/formation protein HypD